MHKLAGSLVARKGRCNSAYRLVQFHSPEVGMQRPVFDKSIPDEGNVLYPQCELVTSVGKPLSVSSHSPLTSGMSPDMVVVSARGSAMMGSNDGDMIHKTDR